MRPSARLITILVLTAVVSQTALAQIEYERPVEVAPTEEDIGEGYVTPPVQWHPPRATWLNITDAGLLLAGLGISAWLGLARRSRTGIVLLAIACAVYFGFYRKGCVCPIGAIQNVAVALTDPNYAVSYVVVLFFFAPLVLALLFGRIFCGGVCPFGAIQELVVLRPLQVPRRLDKVLGLLKYVYLGLAIWFAVQPAVERDFIICRFDPFVGFFRRTGPAYMLIIGGALLVLGMFIGRPYCRYLCPYGGLLAQLARFSWKGVTITPNKELDCGLCAESCPYGAIENMRAVRTSCLSCARCYSACPRERAPSREDASAESHEAAG